MRNQNTAVGLHSPIIFKEAFLFMSTKRPFTLVFKKQFV